MDGRPMLLLMTYGLVNVGLGRIAGVSTNGTQAGATAPLGFWAIDPFQSGSNQQGHGCHRADRDKHNCGRLPNGLFDSVRHQHSDAQADRRPGQSQ